MYRHWLSSALALLATLVGPCRAFDLVREYSGSTFFDRWDFYGFWDNLTLGNAWYLNATEASSAGLAYINEQGHAIMKVDNTSFIQPPNDRNSIRITSQDFYDYGSLWVIDLYHIPYGCSVWPAFWSKGSLWPDDGEIDIIEAINMMSFNQMALHTTAGCTHDPSIPQTGRNTWMDCSQGSGCVVAETKPNSYNSGFAAAGGGVWATQFDVSGIYMWFWSRPDIPESILQANSTSPIDISQWGLPSASFPTTSSCNITKYFTPQQLLFDITLCGDWAGVPGIYKNDCANSGTNGTCYGNNVIGPGSPTFDNAYFEVGYLRAYTTGAATPSPTQVDALPPTTFSASDPPQAGSGEPTTVTNTAQITPNPTRLAGTNNTTESGASVVSINTLLGIPLFLSLVFVVDIIDVL